MALLCRNTERTNTHSWETEDRYLKFVQWSDQDNLYVGYCFDLFPWGGVCHSADEDEANRILRELVRDEVADLLKAGEELPIPSAWPERELAAAAQ